MEYLLTNCDETLEIFKKISQIEEERNKYKQIIENVKNYIEKVETFAVVDKINIMSITTLKKILEGDDDISINVLLQED